jgi:hypothetical protein
MWTRVFYNSLRKLARSRKTWFYTTCATFGSYKSCQLLQITDTNPSKMTMMSTSTEGKTNSFEKRLKKYASLTSVSYYKDAVEDLEKAQRMDQTLSGMERDLAFLWDRVEEKKQIVYRDIQLQDELDNGKKINPFDFSFMRHDESRLIMETMCSVVHNTPGMEKWIENYQGLSHWEDAMFQQLVSHSECEKLCLSGLTGYWGVSQLRCIYQSGWDHWVKLMLEDRGFRTA